MIMQRTSIRSAFLILTLAATFATLLFFGVRASAQESSITFPVAELGNCESKKACHAYCDDLANVNECVAFAETHGLLNKDEAKKAKEFARLGGKGPGGCTSRDECESYCEDPSNMRQCLAFAKESGMMDGHELEEAEKVASYLESGGSTPGNCRGERQCRTYCEAEGHMEECVEFAIKMGFMSEKEAEMVRKTGGKGPGGCKGKACQTYCEDEANREQCISFAMEHDLMSAEDKRRMEEGREKAKEALEKAPPEVLACIEAAMGADKVAALRSGEGFISPRLGEVLPRCFREVMGNRRESGPFGPGSSAADCMRKVFGDDFEEKMRSGEFDPGARDNEIRECMKARMGEGFLNDSGKWERPERGEPSPSEHGQQGERRMPPEGMMQLGPQGGEGDARRGFEEKYRRQFEGRYDENEMRAQMERRMREEIESQMRSGNFDPSKLPPDFRPEGMFPPPESLRRPPEGYTMPPPGMPMPPEGPMPSDRYIMPQGYSPEGFTPPPVPPSSNIEGGPTSMQPQSFMANVISIFERLIYQAEPSRAVGEF